MHIEILSYQDLQTCTGACAHRDIVINNIYCAIVDCKYAYLIIILYNNAARTEFTMLDDQQIRNNRLSCITIDCIP